MTAQVVKMRSRGFICVNAHPEGCRRNVERQIEGITSARPANLSGSKNVLVIGASTGYGLASRIAAAWGFGARTLGIFFERTPDGDRTATAGYYNSVGFHERAKKDGLFAASLNCDAFADSSKRDAITILKKEMAPVDLVIYSLASPRRTHPETGQTHESVLRPIGREYQSKTIELDSERVTEVSIHPASEKEIADTVAVMGGDDWRRWMRALLDEGLLALGARTLAYSYIGPEMTWPIYRDGTIGMAKKDLEAAAAALDAELQKRVGGRAWISVNKAVVTQASVAIPVVPLYKSLLFKIMKAKGLHEGALEQMRRLFFEHLADGQTVKTDDGNRIRVDDREMRPDVQQEIAALWPKVATENLHVMTDFSGYKRDFRNLFGFEVEGVDYGAPVETDTRW
jgi:enoyl-[acyl-carrier protein] reductase/trans-2-enoyl-CoA reductase (NAD+)